MKNALLLSLLCTSLTANTQSIEWAPTGAKWTYSYIEFYWPVIDYTELESIGDTIINGQPCKHLQATIEDWNTELRNPIFMYGDSSGKVFYYQPEMDTFWMLYDFAANPGDQWPIPCREAGDTSGFMTFIVDSVSQISLSGETRRVLYVTLQGNGEPYCDVYSPPEVEQRIIEGIGHTAGMFPWRGGLVSDGVRELRCYEDSAINFTTNGYDSLGCHFTGIEDNFLPTGLVDIFPSPASDQIYIAAKSNFQLQGVEIILSNSLGQIMLNTEANSGRIATLKTTGFPGGIYYVRLKAEGQISKVQRIVIAR